MRAAVFQGIGLGQKIETVADPEPKAHEVVIRVERSGICATDLMMTEKRKEPSPLDPLFEPMIKPGIILGHEIAGEVIAVGAEVERLKLGDRVTPTGLSGCGTCLTCRAGRADWCAHVHAKMGGYAEYAIADERFSARLPRSISLDECALIEPMATSLHAVSLADIRPGMRIAVFGAGPIGLGIVHFARRSRAQRVIVIARTMRHRDLATVMGADGFLTQGPNLAQDVSESLGGPPDVVFDAAGAAGVMDQAIACVRPRGTIVGLSLNMMPDKVLHAIGVMKEIRLQYATSYVLSDFHAVADILVKGETPFHKLITQKVSFDMFPATFEALRAPTANCKVMLVP